MKRKLYVVSKSHLDVPVTIEAFKQKLNYDSVEVIIIGEGATVEALVEGGVSESSIHHLPLVSDELRLRKVMYLVRSLYRERRMIDRLIYSIRSESVSDVIFFSYHMSPHVGYFLHKISITNNVMFLNVITDIPDSLSLFKKPSLATISMAMYRAVLSVVFGRIFGISGSPEYPYIYLKPSHCRVSECGHMIRTVLTAPKKNMFQCPERGGRSAIVLYGDPFFCDDDHWKKIYKMVFDTLAQEEYHILLKVHPTSFSPDFIHDENIVYLPQHLPFELIGLPKDVIIIGLDGGAMVSKVSTPTISLAKMIYEKNHERMNSSMEYLDLNKRPDTFFPNSEDALKAIIRRLKS